MAALADEGDSGRGYRDQTDLGRGRRQVERMAAGLIEGALLGGHGSTVTRDDEAVEQQGDQPRGEFALMLVTADEGDPAWRHEDVARCDVRAEPSGADTGVQQGGHRLAERLTAVQPSVPTSAWPNAPSAR
jgi:hypothetical protein